MFHALAGIRGEDVPDNFALSLTPDNIAAHVASRRAAIRVREWALANPAFVAAFQ